MPEGRPADALDLDFSGLVTPASRPPGGLDLDFGDLVQPASDQRSVVARAIDAASTPLLPQIATGAKALADRLSAPRIGDAQLNDVLPVYIFSMRYQSCQSPTFSGSRC